MNASRRELIASGIVPANPLAAGLRVLKPGNVDGSSRCTHAAAERSRRMWD